MSYLLGIHLGTSSVKCILAAEDGSATAVAEREYSTLTPQPNRSEQAPEDWWRMTGEAVQELVSRTGLAKNEVKAIGLSGQMHGTVFLGNGGKILRPAIIWTDQRSGAQCRQVHQQIGSEKLAQIAGGAVSPGFMLASLLWMQHHDPRNWERIERVMFPKDYVRYRLTGEIGTDITDASGGLLVDIQRRDWSDELLAALSIPADILPPIFESHQVAGHLSSKAAQALGLAAGIPVVAGAADQATDALGSGIVSPGTLAVTIGTSGRLATLLPSPQVDRHLRVHTFCHAAPDSWYLLGATLSAGLSFRWLRDSVLREPPEGAYERMTGWAEKVPPGAGGLLFLPYMLGERTARENGKPKGLLYGMNPRHKHRHLVRSVMEGVVLSLRRLFDAFHEMGVRPDQIIAAGGGARSRLWRQMIADIFQRPVAQLQVHEQSALGAAILAGLGLGIYRDAAEASQTFVSHGPPLEPQPAAEAPYEELYDLFCLLYQQVRRVG